MSWKKKYDKLILAGKINEAIELCYSKISPEQKIYKFIKGTERNFETIKKEQIWLSRANFFNDPFDCSFFVNKQSKVIYDPETDVQMDFSEYIRQKEQDSISKKLQEKSLVTSFAEEPDSILMWSYYAKDHQGYCVEYPLKEIADKVTILPVVYSDTMIQISHYTKDHVLMGMLIKAKCWEHEKEWRIVHIDDGSADEKGKVLEKIPTPTAIFYGARIWNKDNEAVSFYEVLKYAKERRIPIYGYDTNKSDYKLDKVHLKS